MQSSLVLTSFLMGLASGPHCIAMCGAACGSLSKTHGNHSIWQFQVGRVIGYFSLGCLAASSVGFLAWVSSQNKILHPLWTFFHVFVLSWGVVLLIFARQPLWIQAFGKSVWQQIQKLARVRNGILIVGICWALMPCGLLYSAVLLASLSGSPFQGGLSMGLFALGSSVSLLLGQWIWFKLSKKSQLLSESVGIRLAGLALVVITSWAIWMDLIHQTKVFCQT